MSQPNPRTNLINANQLREMLNISEENAYRIMRVAGIRIGGLYFITLDRLEHFLNDTPGAPLAESEKTKSRTRPYKKRTSPIKGSA